MSRYPEIVSITAVQIYGNYFIRTVFLIILGKLNHKSFLNVHLAFNLFYLHLLAYYRAF